MSYRETHEFKSADGDFGAVRSEDDDPNHYPLLMIQSNVTGTWVCIPFGQARNLAEWIQSVELDLAKEKNEPV